MQEISNRQLIDRALVSYTAAGWQIVSQSESSFQVALPHVINSNAAGLLVTAPIVFGVLLYIFSPVFGAALFWVALLLAVLLVLDHLTKRPKLLYFTAEQLRAIPPDAPMTGV